MAETESKEWKFVCDAKEVEKIKLWTQEHRQICKYKNAKTAIGGSTSYCFTPTSIGTVIKVKCVCGEENDPTSYEDW